MNDPSHPSHPFDHERLDVHHLSVEVNHWIAQTQQKLRRIGAMLRVLSR